LGAKTDAYLIASLLAVPTERDRKRLYTFGIGAYYRSHSEALKHDGLAAMNEVFARITVVSTYMWSKARGERREQSNEW
jgi:hypothetical protein